MIGKAAEKKRKERRPAVTLLTLVALMAVIFVADTVTDYAIAAAMFHIAVLLMATRLLSARLVIMLAIVCVALTIASFGLTRSGFYQAGLVNTVISVVAIGVTTYLGLKLKSAELSAHEARERLLRMARLTTLGQLTTSIAHEVSQPLAAISASAGACGRWLDQAPPNVEKARAAVERVANDAGRARDVLARVRGLAKNESPRKVEFDLNQAVSEILELSSGDMARTGTKISLLLEDGLPAAFADRVQIQQTIGNLLLNAIDAVSELPERVSEVVLATERADAGMIRFSLSDNGPGLSEDAAHHLFDAFWTTKEGGFGLGLTISRAIIEANGGRIWTSPGPEGQGATFVFDIPAAKEGGE